jgi:hypothetical protein
MAFLTVPCLHAEARDGALLSSLPVGLHDSFAFADLDGDRHADMAIAHPRGRVDGAYRYQIEIVLSAQPYGAFEIESGPVAGLRITARDVDGDHDLDLVITDAFTRETVGVWINDGNGQFTRAEAENCWKPAPQSADYTLADPGFSHGPVLAFVTSGCPWAIDPVRGSSPGLCAKGSPFRVAAMRRRAAVLHPGNPLRAPPLS